MLRGETSAIRRLQALAKYLAQNHPDGKYTQVFRVVTNPAGIDIDLAKAKEFVLPPISVRAVLSHSF